jgi:hypothetical protein
MQSRTRLRAIAMTLLSAKLASCAPLAVQTDVGSFCSQLVPTAWANGVPTADLPVPGKLSDGHDDARPWQQGFLEQTGQLEKANDRQRDTLQIFQTCEKMKADALKRSTRRGIF